MRIRCVASCTKFGEPTFFPCEVEVTPEQYADGDHYDIAREMAFDEDYEQVGVIYDRNDGPDFLFDNLFAGESDAGEED